MNHRRRRTLRIAIVALLLCTGIALYLCIRPTPEWHLITPEGREWRVTQQRDPSGIMRYRMVCTFSCQPSDIAELCLMVPSSMPLLAALNGTSVYEQSNFSINACAPLGEQQPILPYYQVQFMQLPAHAMQQLKEGTNTLELISAAGTDMLKDPSFGLAAFTAKVAGRRISPGNLAAPYAQTNAPRLFIETGGTDITDQKKVSVHIRYDHGKEHLEWRCEMKARGNTSLTAEKKSYNLKLDGNAVVPGYPNIREWVLYGSWFDLSQSRNRIAYGMWSGMEHPSPAFEYVELWINNNYRGLYGLVQRPSLEMINAQAETGARGLFLSDRWETGDDSLKMTWWSYLVKEPGPDDTAAWNQLREDIGAFEGNIYYADRPPHFDIASFADFMLLQEATGNPDAYRLSTFFYTDRSGKVFAGPAWDFDLAFHPLADTATWLLNRRKEMPGFWFGLFDYTPFRETLRQRYDALRQSQWRDSALRRMIDDIFDAHEDLRIRDRARFPWPSGSFWPYVETPSGLEDEKNRLTETLLKRLAWMDAHL